MIAHDCCILCVSVYTYDLNSKFMLYRLLSLYIPFISLYMTNILNWAEIGTNEDNLNAYAHFICFHLLNTSGFARINNNKAHISDYIPHIYIFPTEFPIIEMRCIFDIYWVYLCYIYYCKKNSIESCKENAAEIFYKSGC